MKNRIPKGHDANPVSMKWETQLPRFPSIEEIVSSSRYSKIALEKVRVQKPIFGCYLLSIYLSKDLSMSNFELPEEISDLQQKQHLE